MSENETLTINAESAADLFEAGMLDEAIAAQIQAVKSDPGNEAKRLFLFELAVLAGQWDRAGRQLEAVNYPDAERNANVAAYRALLDAERQRADVLATGKRPELLIDAPANVEQRIEALQHLANNRPGEAASILRQIDEDACSIHGELNDKPFDVLRDCDDLFGSVLEVFSTTGTYYWVPLQQVASLTVVPPQQLRDLAWIPATLEMREGPTGDVFLPVRYPGSESHPDNDVRIARSTDWSQAENSPVRGSGVRLYLVGDDAVALPDWRTLTIQ